MRKCEEQMVEAIKKFKEFRCDNTELIKDCDGIGEYLSVKLFGWEIAKCYTTHVLIKGRALSCEHYLSQTTKSRLNAILSLCGKYIYQRDYCWYFSTGDAFGLSTFNYKY